MQRTDLGLPTSFRNESQFSRKSKVSSAHGQTAEEFLPATGSQHLLETRVSENKLTKLMVALKHELQGAQLPIRGPIIKRSKIKAYHLVL